MVELKAAPVTTARGRILIFLPDGPSVSESTCHASIGGGTLPAPLLFSIMKFFHKPKTMPVGSPNNDHQATHHAAAHSGGLGRRRRDAALPRYPYKERTDQGGTDAPQSPGDASDARPEDGPWNPVLRPSRLPPRPRVSQSRHNAN